MTRSFYLIAGMVFLVLQKTAAQGTFLFSGNPLQPSICLQQTAVDTGIAGEVMGPCLYLLSGTVAAAFPVAGTYTNSGTTRCYKPLYPLAAGQHFLLRAKGNRDTIISVTDNKVIPAAAPAVAAIYPIADSIPENILFFHVRFTQPMEEDHEAWKKVSITDEQGTIIPRTWRQRSFWLDSGRLLVLMIHPGRVKSGIHYTGPVFEKGRHYTVTVDSSITNIYGRQLSNTVSHRYHILPEQKKLLQTCSVTRRIKARSKEPLAIRFCKGVDHAAAFTGIFIYDDAGNPLPCIVQQSAECVISLQPLTGWPKGKLRLELAGTLYDCAGNRQNRLFEMKKKKTYRKDRLSNEFSIKAY